MVLSLTTARTTYGSKIPAIPKRKGHYDVWSYVHETMLRLGCSRGNQYIFESENHTEQVPPFACSFSKMTSSPHLLAAVDEDGYVTLIDTRQSAEIVKVFRTHKNAVFDVAWASGKNQLVTASGDQMAALWDVAAGKALGIFMGHSCSLKSVCFRPGDCHVFATGARDGNILVWDTRCNNRGGNQVSHHTAVNIIKEAHAEASKLRGTPSRRRSRLSPSMPVRGDNLSSVTVVNFQDDMSLYSAGATDSTIKVWDLRKCNKGMKKGPSPRQVYPYAGSSIKNGGFSSLVFNSTRSEFFASCTDDVIYRFSTLGSPKQPVATYCGHQNSSFYVKSALSRDDCLLLSGSGDGKAYIWDVNRPMSPPVILCGHEDEVTMVAWAEDDFPKLVTGADDCSLCIWRLHQHEESPSHCQAPNDLIGHAERSKPANQMKENVPPVVKSAASSPICHSTPPHQNRATSGDQDSQEFPASSTPTTPTTPRPLTRRNSSISDWLKGSPKMGSKDKDSTQDTENSCPVKDSTTQRSPTKQTKEGRPSVLGCCVSTQGNCSDKNMEANGVTKVVTNIESKMDSGQKLKENDPHSKDNSPILKNCDKLIREQFGSVFQEQRSKDASFVSNTSSCKQIDVEATTDSDRKENKQNSFKSVKKQVHHQGSSLKTQSADSDEMLHPVASTSEKLDAGSQRSPLVGQKRKREDSTETPGKNAFKTELVRSPKQDASVLVASTSEEDLPRPVKRSRSLDLGNAKMREDGTVGKGRGSLTCHVQHLLCKCSCSVNRRHPTGNLTASSGTAEDESGQTVGSSDSPGELSSSTDIPKTNSCTGSSRNICFYFRPHTREVKRAYSDSTLVRNKPALTVLPEQATTC